MIHYTGLRVDLGDWERESQRVKSGAPGARKKNKELDALAARVEKVFYSADLTEGSAPFTRGQFQKAFRERSNTTHTLLATFEKYLQEMAQKSGYVPENLTRQVATVSPALFLKYRNAYRHLREYLGNKKDIEFEDIDKAWMEGMRDFLLTRKGHVNNTATKVIKVVKAVIRRAMEDGLHTNEKYRQLPAPEDSVPIITLNWEQVMKIYNVELEENELDLARDIFLFQVATALRYSDVRELRHTDIQDGIIRLITHKGKKPTAIPLNFLSREILEKYGGLMLEGGRVFPVPVNHILNTALKEVGKRAGLIEPVVITRFRGEERVTIGPVPLYERLTTHVGRKTFVSIAFYLGMPKELIMAITTHSSPAVIDRHYLSIMPEHIKQVMEQVFQKDRLK